MMIFYDEIMNFSIIGFIFLFVVEDLKNTSHLFSLMILLPYREILICILKFHHHHEKKASFEN